MDSNIFNPHYQIDGIAGKVTDEAVEPAGVLVDGR
jgi:hypothetical protein